MAAILVPSFLWTSVNHLIHIQELTIYCMHSAYSRRSRKGVISEVSCLRWFACSGPVAGLTFVIEIKISSNLPLPVQKTINECDLYSELFVAKRKRRIYGISLSVGGASSICIARTAATLRQVEHENEELQVKVDNLVSEHDNLVTQT